MFDCRDLVRRAIKAKSENKKLTPSSVEGTIFGVDHKDYKEALTYPKCLKISNFLHFLLSPTFCY